MDRTFVLHDETFAARLYQFLKQNWKSMADSGHPLAVTVTEAKATRSEAQNRRLWAIYKDIAASAWVNGRQFSDEAWHEFFKGEFIGWIDRPDGGRSPMSSAKLNVEEFGQFMTKIEAYAATELAVELMA